MMRKYKISPSSDFGKCLKALSTINENELIIDLKENSFLTKRDKYTIETDIGNIMHFEGMFLSHSCNPNSKVIKSAQIIVSIKEIKKGEIISFDYLENESTIISPFFCNCKKCIEDNSRKYICS